MHAEVFKLINAAAGADTLRSIRPRRHFDSILTAAVVLHCIRECARLLSLESLFYLSHTRLTKAADFISDCALYCHDWVLLKRILTKFNIELYTNRT